METALVNATVFTGERLLGNQAVVINDGTISRLCLASQLPSSTPTLDLDGQLLCPGFIDTQVNGGGGVMFNDMPNLHGLETIAKAHRRFGSTSILPTLITDSDDKIHAAQRAIELAIDKQIPGILGIHIEGPYISLNRRGVHEANFIRSLDKSALALLSRFRKGIRLITLAPENQSAGVITKLCEMGFIVNAGHSSASFEQTEQALEEGLCGFTHVYNAMPPMQNREPGLLGAALTDSNSWCGVIVDRFHVHKAALQVLLRSKPKGKVILVTDAMATVGSSKDSFNLYGQTIYAVDGRCALDDGTLAGSDLNMAQAVKNTVEFLGVPLTDALRMASLYPAEFIGREKELGRIANGYRADLVLLNKNLNVSATWVAGEQERYE